MKRNIYILVPIIALALALGSCSNNVKNPGRIYMPDMTYSNAFETYSKSPMATPEGNHMSARLPVANTIPRGWIPNDPKIKTDQAFLMSYMAKNHFTHNPDKWQEEYDRAGTTLKNPIEASPENMAEGKRIYEINCTPCHGIKGEGNGQLVELPGGGDGPYTSRPPTYAARLPTITDGNMFYSVSYGVRMMGGYGFQLNPTERWQVINYIKGLAGIGSAAAPAVDSTAKAMVKK